MSENDHNSTELQVQENERTASAVLKLLAIIGLIAILALAAWISIQVIRLAPTAFSSVSSAVSSASGSFSSLFVSNDDEKLAFALSTSTLASDEPFTIMWKGEQENEVIYTLSYECVDGFTLRIQEGEDYTETTCDEPHEFTTSNPELSVIPVSETNRFLDVKVTLSTKQENEEGAEEEVVADSITLTVINEEVTGSPAALVQDDNGAETPAETPSETTTTDTPTVTTPTEGFTTTEPQTVYVPNKRSSENPDGSADLAITILGTGVVVDVDDKDSFFPLSPLPLDQRAAVQFKVENIGDKTSDEWTFRASLPIEGDPDYEFESPDQEKLRPGDSMEFTLKFDTIVEREKGMIKIDLDAGRDDEKSSNDSDVVVVDIDD